MKAALWILAAGLGAAPAAAPPVAPSPTPVPSLRAPAAGPLIALDSPLWRRQSSWSGITLYEAPNQRGGVVPVKAEMSIPGSIEEISVILEDIPRRGEWLVNYGESRLVERESDYHQVEYLRMNMPWPIADRTALVAVDISVGDDPKSATIAAESVDCCQPAGLPVFVRARVHASTFQMIQEGDHVRVLGLVFIDPQGSIPKWAVNLYTRHVARETLSNLRRQVQRHLYGPAPLEAMARRIRGYKAWKAAQNPAGR